jgi:AraC-like DNA-binding protein
LIEKENAMYHLFQPANELSAFIDCYWESDFKGLNNDIYSELFVAQFNPNIIINITDNYKHNHSIIKKNVLNTINTSAITFTHKASNQLFGIRFKPAGFNMFSAIGLHEIVDNSILLTDVFGADVEAFEDKICEAKDTLQRIEIANQFFLSKIKEANLVKFEFNSLVQKSISKNANKPNLINEVAIDLNTTQRTLDRNFKQFLGLSPKKLHRLIRFQKVYEALHSPKMQSQTFDFYHFGYYDQAHFSKEFKEFVGLTYQEYLQSPYFVQNLQDNHYL